MLFNSWLFALFFALLFALYGLSRRSLRLQNILILVGSYVFYGAWDARFLLLIVVSTATDYLAGLGASGEHTQRRDLARALSFTALATGAVLALEGRESLWILGWVAGFAVAICALVEGARHLSLPRRKSVFVWSSVVVNLGILGVFKYFNFFADSLADLASGMGLTLGRVELEIILPVGISFYTFQTMSYTLDAYRGRLRPTRDFLNLAAFVSFFPQLVAGPIERARNLLPQIERQRSVDLAALQSAAVLFLWGLFKKIVVADNLARLADPVFADPGSFASGDQIVALLAFTFQIYCDFSGYTDMARGLARALGFEIMLNFNLPYISRTPSEFWERWHISLSSWLRDYLYIPLGGNRGGALSTYRNLALTMLLGGLWHGASWTFVAWGAWHGLILIGYRVAGVDAWLADSRRSGLSAGLRDAALAALLFGLVVLGWLLFRAGSMTEAWIFVSTWITEPALGSERWVPMLKLLWPLLLVQWAQVHWRELEVLPKLPPILRFHVALIVVLSLLFLSAPGGQEFIYFDF